MRVLIDLDDSGIEGSFLFESIALPQFDDLANDLLAAGISFLPFDGAVETIRDAVDLQAGGVVYFLWFCLAGGIPQVIIKLTLHMPPRALRPLSATKQQRHLYRHAHGQR